MAKSIIVCKQLAEILINPELVSGNYHLYKLDDILNHAKNCAYCKKSLETNIKDNLQDIPLHIKIMLLSLTK